MLIKTIKNVTDESILENSRIENEIWKLMKEVASISEIRTICPLNFCEELLVHPYDKSVSLLEKYHKENDIMGFINKVQESLKNYLSQNINPIQAGFSRIT